ncbi:MAG: conjugal transfer protein TraH [Comamonadaceae bacterium]|nr:conjugal transfer protein TraH [Comamonadaceae bacterium]
MKLSRTIRMARRSRCRRPGVARWPSHARADSQAGDLNTEVNNMFNSLGAIGNYTAPGAFRGQTFNTYTGGNLFMRAPNKVYQLAADPVPQRQGRLRRHRRLRRLVLPHLGRRVQEHAAQHHRRAAGHRLPAGAGVGLAAAGRADQVGEGAGDLDQQRPHQLLRDRQGHRQHGGRSGGLQLAGGLRRSGHRDGPGDATATQRAGAAPPDRTSILASARSSRRRRTSRNKAPFVGNLTWKALQRTGTYLDDQERELIMSIVGTVIFYPEDVDARPRADRADASPRSASCSTARPPAPAPT